MAQKAVLDAKVVTRLLMMPAQRAIKLKRPAHKVRGIEGMGGNYVSIADRIWHSVRFGDSVLYSRGVVGLSAIKQNKPRRGKAK